MVTPTPEQRRAADPDLSIWVDANAGTGKTGVLTDRVLGLLFKGVPPNAILCLTFTKAAAGEMRQRVERRLAEWAVAGPDALAQSVELMTGTAPTVRELERAAGLFDAVNALPAGLSIMTIHSLCQLLLRRFPIEAEVAPHFDLLDDRSAEELRLAAERRVLGESVGSTALRRHVETLIATGADSHWLRGVESLLRQRRGDKNWREPGAVLAEVADRLHLDIDGKSEALWERAVDAAPDDARLRDTAEALNGRNDTQTAYALAIRAWLALSAVHRSAKAPALLRDLASPTDGVWAPKRWTQSGPKLTREEPEAASALCELVKALGAAEREAQALTLLRRTQALLGLAVPMAEATEELKRIGAALDFDDLIAVAALLLGREGMAEWVRYKLDRGIDHLLVDEAQDTSPSQWRVVEGLIADFFAGEGAAEARGVRRTIFVVGDEKQSIYGFQGADLETFRAVRARLEERSAAAAKPFETIVLQTSFRSSSAILDLVNAVLELSQVRSTLDRPASLHRAHDGNAPGRVELWPLVPADFGGESEDPSEADRWAAPPRAAFGTKADRAIAEAIAGTVGGWLKSGELLEGTGRPIGPGDVMVLLQKRGQLQDELVRAFKRNRVRVLGADRLLLKDHIAVMDLIAVGEAALLPANDFALACALKSPLFGADEADLFRLAAGRRKHERLVDRLRALADEGGAIAEMWQRFERLRNRVDFIPPYEWYLELLAADGGRRRLIARLGEEAVEPIDAFLAQALVYERGHPASLQGFLTWLQLWDQEVKREAETASDAVRVLTVHGAKGLEAPIVFLADAGPSKRGNEPPLLWTPDGLPLWRTPKKDADPLTLEAYDAAAVKEAAEDKRRLYVALTRAAKRLYVLGRTPKTGDVADCWHGLVDAGMNALADVAEISLPPAVVWPGNARVYQNATADPLSEAAPSQNAGADEAVAPALPAWLRRPPPASTVQALRPATGSPSDAGAGGDSDNSLGDPASGAAPALAIGQHLHRLLERLGPEAAADPEPVIRAYLAAHAAELGPLAVDIETQVLRLLAVSELEPWFHSPEILVEQTLVGSVAGRMYVGQLDRLVVHREQGELWIGDFKSGRPPGQAAATPVAYLRQMAIYRELTRAALSGFRVRCALLWTEDSRAQWLDDTALDAYMPEPEGGRDTP